MSKKWMKVDPTTLKVGDEVRWVMAITGGRVIREVAVREIAPDGIRLGLAWAGRNMGTFYVRKMKKSKPPTRPDEPPVGSFFRVDRTGREFYRYPQVSLTHYFHLACDAGDRPWVAWADVTEPGDTITRLLLVGATDD